MNSLRCSLQKKTFYFICFLTAVIISIIVVSSTGKINCFIGLNGLHTKWLDMIFIGFTFLGDGLFSIVTGIISKEIFAGQKKII
jgi:hypothetical protein